MAILKDTTINGDLRVNGRITPAGGIYYGVCSTAASTQAKTVTIPGITEYYEGLMVRIIFTNNQTYNGTPTLNINGLGAVALQVVSGANMARYAWSGGTTLDLIYNASGKFVASCRNTATTTYYGITKLSSALGSSEVLAATQYFASRKSIRCNAAFSIPAAGSSITKNLPGLLATFELVSWNFSDSPENQPPCDLTWTTGTDSFTITNNGGTSSETIQPTFIWPFDRAVTDPT